MVQIYLSNYLLRPGSYYVMEYRSTALIIVKMFKVIFV